MIDLQVGMSHTSYPRVVEIINPLKRKTCFKLRWHRASKPRISSRRASLDSKRQCRRQQRQTRFFLHATRHLVATVERTDGDRSDIFRRVSLLTGRRMTARADGIRSDDGNLSSHRAGVVGAGVGRYDVFSLPPPRATRLALR
jgi:hypothetical protein